MRAAVSVSKNNISLRGRVIVGLLHDFLAWLLRDKHLSKDLMFGMGGHCEENARGNGLPASGERLEP